MQKNKNTMIIPTLILGFIAIGLLIYGHNNGVHMQGLKNGFTMTIQILPLLFFSFIIAGMMQVLVSPDALLKWIGPESGAKGIFLGTITGAITPGGPFVSLPIVAGFIHSGAGIGTTVAFITSWSLWAIMRLPLEIGILGWEFTIVRLVSSAILPIIAGFIARFFFSWVTII
ncbi:MAG: permease [Candidatus Cloacimonadota bacterium]|nr:permease [Candidatus Cloacimonadota bacterium]